MAQPVSKYFNINKTTSSTTSSQKPNYLQDLEKRKLELQSKITREGTQIEKPVFTIKPEAPQNIMNFGPGVSQKGVTNVNEYNPVTKRTENIFTPKPTTTEQSSGFSLIPTANADNGKNIIQKTQKLPKNLFSDEKEALDRMLQDGIPEEKGLEIIKERRESMLMNTNQQEKEALLKMQQDGLDSNSAVAIVENYRRQTDEKWAKENPVKNFLRGVYNVPVGATALATEQVGNILDFTTGGKAGFGQDVAKLKATNKYLEDSTGSDIGRTILGVGEMVATPTKIPGLGKVPVAGKYLDSGIGKLTTMGAIEGGVMPVLEKGNESTAQDIGQSALIGGTIGAGLGLAGKGLQKTGQYFSTEKPLQKGGELINASLNKTAENISTKANRFNAKDIEDFVRITGEKPGEFAVKRGMTKTGDEAVDEATKNWIASMKEADDALEQIGGNFKIQQGPDFIEGAIEGLQGKLSKYSPEIKRVNELAEKYKSDGLTFPEINELKRLYSRNHKYSWVEAGSKQAIESKDIQDGLRNWQFSKAKDMGLQNLDEINRNTQGWREFADNLSKKIKRSEGNNNISLTDWVSLSGGNPTNIALYLGKKVGESKKFKELLIRKLGKQTKEAIIKPNINKPNENLFKVGKNLLPPGPIITPAPELKSEIKVTPSVVQPNTRLALPEGKKQPIITPQTNDAGIIQESKIPLKKTKYGNNSNISNSVNSDRMATKLKSNKSKNAIPNQTTKISSKDGREVLKTKIDKNTAIANSYKESAKERFKQGDFTQTEIRKGYEKLNSLYEGRKDQLQDGTKFEIVSKPAYGKVKVKMEDGTIKNMDTENIYRNQKQATLTEVKEYLQGTEYKGFNLNRILPSNFKEKAQDLVDKTMEKIGGKMNIMGNEGIGADKTALLKGSDDLISEARRYKTFDEFKKSQGQELYHGTSSDFVEFLKEKMGTGEGSDLFGRGIYLTDNNKIADFYAKNAYKISNKSDKVKNIMNTYINKNAKIKDLTSEKIGDFVNELNNWLDNNKGIAPGLENNKYGRWLHADMTPGELGQAIVQSGNKGILTKFLEEKGYGGIKFKANQIQQIKGKKGINFVIFDPENIKTESQLKQIYEQAQKPKLLKKTSKN